MKYYLLSVRHIHNEELHLMTVGNDRQIIESTFCELNMMVDTLVGLWPSVVAFWSSEPGKFTLEAESIRSFPEKRKDELYDTVRQWRDAQDGPVVRPRDTKPPTPAGATE